MNHPGLSGLAITSVMLKVIDKRVLRLVRPKVIGEGLVKLERVQVKSERALRSAD